MADQSELPRLREVTAIAAAAVLLRAAIFVTILASRHVSTLRYAQNGDGASYLDMAQAMRGDSSHLSDYDRRVFPGYSALIALGGWSRLPLARVALGIDWLSAGVAAALAALLLGDRRVGWAMVVLLPQYVINSSMAMSEAPMLALSLVGLCLAWPDAANRRRTLAGGIILGLAGLVRPMACFAVAGCVGGLLARKQGRRALVVAVAAGLTVLGGILALRHWSGGALRGIRIYQNSPQAYAGHLLAWPFKSLLLTPFRERRTVESWSIAYIWAHVLIVLLACGLLLRRYRRAKTLHAPLDAPRDARDALATPWLVGNTLFVLCIGSGWGFRHFPRFTIPALPALFWALRAWLPRPVWAWVALGVAAFAVGVAGVAHSL